MISVTFQDVSRRAKKWCSILKLFQRDQSLFHCANEPSQIPDCLSQTFSRGGLRFWPVSCLLSLHGESNYKFGFHQVLICAFHRGPVSAWYKEGMSSSAHPVRRHRHYFNLREEKSLLLCICCSVISLTGRTDYYFDNRLVGRLFFRLIGLKHFFFFFFYKKTHYSTFCPMSFKQTCQLNDTLTVLNNLLDHLSELRENTNILRICRKKKLI